MTPKENLLRAIRRQRPKWVPNGMEGRVLLTPPVVERPGRAKADSFGVQWVFDASAQGGSYPAPGAHVIRDLNCWREQLRIPDLESLDWSGVAEQAGRIDRREHLVCGMIEIGLFERSYLLLGMEEALMAYLSETEMMAELISALADYKIRLIEKFDDVVDLDMVWYGDDWGTQRALFVSPAIWRRVIKPHTKRIYDVLKARGILIDQHSCGKIEDIFGDLVELGADIYNPCQPCNDLARLKRQYGGRIAFSGGIDSQFVLARPGVTPDEVRAEVRLRIDQLGAAGGFIAGPSHGVPYAPELLAAMNSEIATYGQALYL